MNRYANMAAIREHLSAAPAPEGLFTPESEEAVIAAALAAPTACDDAFDKLTPAHFGTGFNGEIWRAILQLHRAGG